jgi:hypothetical protein
MSVEAVAGAFLIVAPVWFNATFALLGKRFDYPDILRRPATEILDRFRAGGSSLILLWRLFMLSGLLLIPAVVLLGQALGRLFAVAEAYPDLKADARFRDLQDELVATENKIAFSRQLYNDTVKAYTDACQRVPTVLIAKPFGFSPPAYFAAEGEERGVVGVEFE